MIYSDLEIGDKMLKLRLDSRGCVALEKKLGKAPLTIFMNIENELPLLGDMITILQAALQKFQTGYTMDKTYDLYDEYVEGGGTQTDFIKVVMDIFKVSGYFKESDVDKAKIEIEKKQLAVTENL